MYPPLVCVLQVKHVCQVAEEIQRMGKCVVIGLKSTGEARTLEAVEVRSIRTRISGNLFWRIRKFFNGKQIGFDFFNLKEFIKSTLTDFCTSVFFITFCSQRQGRGSGFYKYWREQDPVKDGVTKRCYFAVTKNSFIPGIKSE